MNKKRSMGATGEGVALPVQIRGDSLLAEEIKQGNEKGYALLHPSDLPTPAQVLFQHHTRLALGDDLN